MAILTPHFGNIIAPGIEPNNPLAVALDRALELQTSSGQIRAAYGDLRAIPRETAQQLGFKDAAIHGEDDATHCMFGGALSTRNFKERPYRKVRRPIFPLGDI